MLYDIYQIEVFKGPNSTLFGQNATGGSIHITSREPTKRKSLDGIFSLENFNGSSTHINISNIITKNTFYNLSIGKFLESKILRISLPTFPVAPTTAIL